MAGPLKETLKRGRESPWGFLDLKIAKPCSSAVCGASVSFRRAYADKIGIGLHVYGLGQ